MGLHTKIRWNDGEGLNADDLTTATVGTYAEFIEALSPFGGGDIGAALDCRYSATAGADPVVNQISLRNERVNLPAAKLFAPHSMLPLVCVSTTISATGASPQLFDIYTSAVYIGPGTCFMSRANVVSSTPPGMSADSPLVYVMSALTYDLGAALASTAASITSALHASFADSARFDTLAIKLDHATTSESRDFEDAVTRTLTTVSTPKVDAVTCDFEYASGSVAATTLCSGAPAISSGYAPLVSIRRAHNAGAGISGAAPWLKESFYYHAYPTRYAEETVFPHDFMMANTSHYYYTGTNGLFPTIGELSKAGTLSGTHYIYIIPRNMHAACRLLGISFCMPDDAAQIDKIDFMAYQWASDGYQIVSTDDQLSLNAYEDADLALISGVNSRWLNASTEGVVYVGEQDWSPNAAYPTPIWGNGTHWGPLFSTMRKNWASFDVSGDFSHGAKRWLALRLSVTNTLYSVGPFTFHYLY